MLRSELMTLQLDNITSSLQGTTSMFFFKQTDRQTDRQTNRQMDDKN